MRLLTIMLPSCTHGGVGAIEGHRGGDQEDGGGWAGARGGLHHWLVCHYHWAVRAGAWQSGDRFLHRFHRLGLGLPLHRFMRGLLFFYSLHLHDRMLEGILHIETFMTLCVGVSYKHRQVNL